MGIEPNIPVNTRNGGKPTYNIELYRRMRSAVERFFGWLKSFRRVIIIRYEKLASTYKALVTIASIIIHLRYGILR